MSTEINPKMIPLNCFKRLHLIKYNYKDDSFHEILEKEGGNVLQLYKKSHDFNDIVPLLQKKDRGNYFYKKLVYNGFRGNSPLMKALAKIIKKYEVEKNINVSKRKFQGIYKLPSLEILKKKKIKIESIKKNKLKELKIKSDDPNSSKYFLRSLSNFNFKNNSQTQKVNYNYNLNDTNYSVNNNLSVSNRFSKISFKSPNKKELSTYYNSDTNFGNSLINTYNILTSKINKPNYIISKCREEINSGNEVYENVNQTDKTITTTIRRKYQAISLMQKSQSLSLDAVGMKKYKNMEINNMNEIKRKMNERISDSMAFKNMKGLKENLKNAESTNAYYIYMHDMDKTNARLEERRNKAKKIIDKVELLCEDEVNKKEYLKNLIDIYNKKHSKIKNLQKINIKKSESNLMQNNKIESESDDENLNIYNPKLGNFFPKLLTLREQNIEQINVGNFLFKKKKNNTKQNTDK